MNTEKPKLHKKIRKGDTVIAIAGNARGQTGKVLSRTNERVVVQGLNIRKKHVKKSQLNPKGGVSEFEGSMHISNVKIFAQNEKAVKLKVRHDQNGNRELFFKEGDQEVLYRSVKQS